MISPETIQDYMAETGTGASTMARKLGMSKNRFDKQVAIEGLNDAKEIEIFNLILKNDQETKDFTYSEIAEFQEAYAIPDYVLCLYLGVATSTLSNMKSGQPISPSVRKTFRAMRLLNSEGFDIKRYIAEA